MSEAPNYPLPLFPSLSDPLTVGVSDDGMCHMAIHYCRRGSKKVTIKLKK